MESHELEIAIAPNGEVKIHIKGVKGPGCMEYAKMFEKILGEFKEVEHTSEFYEPPTEVGIRLEQDT